MGILGNTSNKISFGWKLLSTTTCVFIIIDPTRQKETAFSTPQKDRKPALLHCLALSEVNYG